MTFEIMDPNVDTPPAMQGLLGLGVLAPQFLIGGAVAAATVASWLGTEEWGTEEYNLWMRKMNDTIGGGTPGKSGGWDALGWKSGCWQKFPGRRKMWLSYWTRFSKFYKANPSFTRELYVPDSEERAARQLMHELVQWGEWLNKTCGAQTGGAAMGLDPAPPPLPSPEGKWTPLVKWGAIGLGALVALNVITGLRGVIPRPSPTKPR